ncbi:MAG TPA: hypothetical protein VMH82_07940 [Myxococcota bacterium]|nr:hypothetical protein [Myxococcota bacterium]
MSEAVLAGLHLAPAVAGLVECVLREAEQRARAVYLVGGPVRDLLLGRPLRDVDLIVEGDAGVAEELARAASPPGVQVVSHDRFGTVRLESSEAALDLAGTRRERYARPGALPSVEPGSVDEDLLRRDFTVNAMALPLSRAARRAAGSERSDEPAVLAPDPAREDLQARVLRILHPRSFHDDPTRALRAARLSVRLGFRLSRGSRAALRDALRDGAFGAVSGDRLRREFEKLFDDAALGADPAAALRRLAEWHVLGALEPGLSFPGPAAAPVRRLGRAIAAPPWARRGSGRVRSWAVGLALWLAEVEAPLRRRALRRLSVRGEVADRVGAFPQERDRRLRALARSRGRGAADALLGGLDDEEVLALWCCAPPTGRQRIVRWAAEDRDRRIPVSGRDLLAEGLSGPAVGAGLARIRAAWLDGAVRSREEALALARELGGTARRRAKRR